MPDKILLVDDEESILASYRRELEGVFYVETASNGEEAIEKMRSAQFDLVIADLIMPGINGLAVLREAKKRNPTIATIILTAHDNFDSAVEALRLEVDDYLLKPCKPQEFKSRVVTSLSKQRIIREKPDVENILPLCMYCRCIRDDSGTARGKGEWMQLEQYLYSKMGMYVSHSICPGCIDRALEMK